MTRSMTRWMLAGFMALVALGVVGAPVQADPPANPFAGSWSGTWAHVEDDMVGTVELTISDGGRIAGTVRNTADGTSGTTVGHVSADGNLVMIGFVPDDEAGSGGSGYPHQGTARIDGDGKLVVSTTATFPGGPSSVAILERK